MYTLAGVESPLCDGMYIINGIYHFRPKRLGFRNDYCLSCGDARRSVHTRTFDAWHLFWIPLVPLGFWKRWICTACGRQPHVSPKTRRSFKWAGFVVLLVFSFAFWVGTLPSDFVVGGWIFRFAAPLGAAFLLVHLLRTPKDPSLRERLATIVPASDTTCPFCGAQLLIGSETICPACGVRRC